MKKSLLLLLVLALLTLGVAIYWETRHVKHADALRAFEKQGLTADDAAQYQITLEALQKTKGSPDVVLVRAKGMLDQYVDGQDKIFTQWNRVDSWVMNNAEVAEDVKSRVIGRPAMSVVTAQKMDHFLDKDFPKDLFRVQLNLLQRIMLPKLPQMTTAVEKQESEELGVHKVRYTGQVDGKVERIEKTWVGYERKDIEVDGRWNKVRYLMTREGRLLGADGVLLLHYKGPVESDFEIRLSLDFIGKAKKPAVMPSVGPDTMTLADADTVKSVANELRAKAGLSYGEAMKKLGDVTAETDGRELYQIFGALKADMVAHPEHGAELVSRILATKGRDAGAKRQIAAMFGALAQSQSPVIADSLSRLASDCPDTYCKEQAIVALNDHQNPTTASADKMIELVKTKPDANIASMAVLAAGSIAKKLPLPELPKTLMEEFKKPENGDIRRSIVAGMGNHGAAEYLPALQESLKDKEPTMRATATYSLRHLNNAAVNPMLLGMMESEKSHLVLREVFKAMNYRRFQGDEYGRIAKTSLSFKDEELATETAGLLLRSYEKDPAGIDGALKILREKSAFASVKRMIENEAVQAR